MGISNDEVVMDINLEIKYKKLKLWKIKINSVSSEMNFDLQLNII